jgi:hypothetical protein
VYSAIVLQATQALKNVEVWLDKAEQHAVVMAQCAQTA